MSREQCDELLAKGGVLVRQTTDYDCGEQTTFWYLIKETFGGFEELSKKTVKYVKRAQERFDIGIVPRERIMSEEGYAVTCKAYAAYKVKSKPPTRSQFWGIMAEYGDDCEFWGCIDRETGQLEAYSVCRLMSERSVFFEESRGNPAFRRQWYVMYGLYYARNAHYLGQRGMDYVVTSARSLTERSEIQDFMVNRFNFRKAYCRLGITYKWYAKAAVSVLYPLRERRLLPAPLRHLLRQEAMARGDY